jgi:glycosyltransferase involved in cell wall biosynthesis
MINLFFIVHNHSGARTYADELLGYLASLKEIRIYKVFIESSSHNEYTEIIENDILNIYIPRVSKSAGSLKKYATRCLDLIQHLLIDKNNLIFHFNYCTQVELALKARERFGARLMYTAHFLPDFMSYCAIDNKKFNGSIQSTGDVLEKLALKETDHIICVTHFAKEAVTRWYETSDEKITVIHNGTGSLSSIKEACTSEKKKTIRRQLGFNEKERLILFVGLIEERKGIKHLLQAFNHLAKEYTDIRLIIAGDGDYKEVFERTKNCRGRITLTGKILKEEVCQLYQIADIGVIPYIFEQCSYVALEMLKYGLPVVVSDVPGLKELYIDHKNALLVPLFKTDDSSLKLEVSEDELERSVERLLSDENLRQIVGINAHKHWEEGYTAKHMGQATMEIYQEKKEIACKGEFINVKNMNFTNN